jgi:CheY-like chemotaxis protein
MADFKLIDLGLETPPEKKLILVVDDEHAMHALIFDILQEDYKLASAFNGSEGVQKAEALAPHLILMDLMMPDTNGYDAIRLLRRHPEAGHIPVIVVTARAFDPTTIQLLKAEPNVRAFINKPFRPKELRDLIKKIIP